MRKLARLFGRGYRFVVIVICISRVRPGPSDQGAAILGKYWPTTQPLTTLRNHSTTQFRYSRRKSTNHHIDHPWVEAIAYDLFGNLANVEPYFSGEKIEKQI